MTTEVSLLSHVTNSALVVYGLEWLKGTERYQRLCKAVPIADEKISVVMSGLGAWATAIGMHGAIEGSAALGWHLALTIPPLWVIFHAVWDWGQQFALNQIVFAIAVQQKKAAPVLTVPVAKDVTVTAPIEKAAP